MISVRVSASFLAAALISIAPPFVMLLVLRHGQTSGGDLLLGILLLAIVPSVVLGGLLWLPTLLAARDRSGEWRFAAVLFSGIPGSAWSVWNVLQMASRNPMRWHWESLIVPAIFMIVFSASFLMIDRRLGERSAPAMVTIFATLVAASALMVWLMSTMLWPEVVPS